MGHVGRNWFFSFLLLSSLTITGWAAPQKPTEHVVQSGQTLAKIAKRYNLTLEELCEANDLKRNSTLKPGQRLSLPTDEDPSPPNRSRQRLDNRAATTVSRTSGTPQKAGPRGGASYARYLAHPIKRGYVQLTGFHGEYKGQLVSKSGKLQPKAAAIASTKVLAWPRTDFVMDKRLLTLLAKVSDAFGGRPLRIVSGYRTSSFASESKHPLGRACDFSVPGVPNGALRDFVRTFDNVGVGYYPNSTFIHLDVREYDAYWVDYAGPGEPPRYQNAIAKKHDKDNDGKSSTPNDEHRRDHASQTTQENDNERRHSDEIEAQADAENDVTEASSHVVTGEKTSESPVKHTEPLKPKTTQSPSASPAAEPL
jgi:LysM repeat protein